MEQRRAARSGARRPGELAIGPTKRILGLDVARALAVIGMVAVNFESVLSNQLGSIGFERLLQLPLGRAAALFVVLAGIGATFLVGRTTREGSLVLARRALVLLVLGYAFLHLAWEEDILHYYGWYFLIAIPCLRLPDRWLLIVAVALTIPTPALLLAGWDFDQGWVLDRLEYMDLWTRAGHLRHLFFNGFFSITPWMAFFLWGIWLGRRLTEDPDYVRRVAPHAFALALALELLSLALVYALGGAEDPVGRLFDTASMPSTPLFVLSAGATATAMLGLGVFLVDRWGRTLPVRVLAHGGQLALSIYVLHVIVGLGPFDVWYQLGCLSRAQVFAWWVVFCYLALFAAHRWRLRFSQGPFEWFLRAIGGSPRREDP